MDAKELDRLFAGARASAAEPSEALFSRVLADAEAIRSGGFARVPPAQDAMTGRASGLLNRLRGQVQAMTRALMAGFGGGAVLASLGGVAVAALFLGYADPSGIAEAVLAVTGTGAANAAETGVEIVPVAEYFLIEG